MKRLLATLSLLGALGMGMAFGGSAWAADEAAAPAAVSRKTTDRGSIKILDRDTSVGSPLKEMSCRTESASGQVGIVCKIADYE